MQTMIDDAVGVPSADVLAGQAAYTPGFLPYYDLLALQINNRFFWRCPTKWQIEMYDRLATPQHLDVGIGSGYFLDKCRFGVDQPHITLVDLNENTLRYVRARLSRYESVRLFRRNVLDPFDLGEKFGSIGVNYLLHCVPGPIESKADRVLTNLKPHLASHGVLFGSTLLMDLAQRLWFSAPMMRAYQRNGSFHNDADTIDGLRGALTEHFDQVELERVGCAALFTARRPRN